MSAAQPITVTYTNWRGQTRERRIIPSSVRWGATERHPQPGWLLSALDVEKMEMREFALADCDFTDFRIEGGEPSDVDLGREFSEELPRHLIDDEGGA